MQSEPALTADGINGLVLDAELVAVDRSDGKVRLRAFQELSTRARGGVTADQVHPFTMRFRCTTKVLAELSTRARGGVTADQVHLLLSDTEVLPKY